jgi:hypothetical protein
MLIIPEPQLESSVLLHRNEKEINRFFDSRRRTVKNFRWCAHILTVLKEFSSRSFSLSYSAHATRISLLRPVRVCDCVWVCWSNQKCMFACVSVRYVYVKELENVFFYIATALLCMYEMWKKYFSFFCRSEKWVIIKHKTFSLVFTIALTKTVMTRHGSLMWKIK